MVFEGGQRQAEERYCTTEKLALCLGSVPPYVRAVLLWRKRLFGVWPMGDLSNALHYWKEEASCGDEGFFHCSSWLCWG